MFKEVLVVVGFAGQGDGADDFDLSAFVDEDVLGVDVADFLAEMLELAASSDDVVEEIPDLGLEEVLFESITV